MKKIGDYIYCNGHGVGQLIGTNESNLTIQILSSNMKLLVHQSSSSIRELSSVEKMEEVLSLLSKKDLKLEKLSFNQRHIDSLRKVKSGNVLEIAQVLSQFSILKSKKELSFGERKTINQCMHLLSQEFSIALNCSQESIIDKINNCIQ